MPGLSMKNANFNCTQIKYYNNVVLIDNTFFNALYNRHSYILNKIRLFLIAIHYLFHTHSLKLVLMELN